MFPRISSARSYYPLLDAKEQISESPHVQPEAVKPISGSQQLVHELFDEISTPIDQIRNCLEDKLLRFVGEGGYVQPEQLSNFEQLISAMPDREGFVQRLKRLVNNDRKSLLLEALLKLKADVLSQELKICLSIDKKPERAAILLRLGANPNICIEGRQIPDFALELNCNPLMMAWANCPDVQPHPYRIQDWTPLIVLSAFCDSPEALRCLLSKGVNINATGKEGVTPLIAAAIQHKTQNMSILLQAGANILVLDQRGRCAWDYADETGKGLIVHALQKKFDAANHEYDLYTKPNPQKMILCSGVKTQPIEAAFREALELSGRGLGLYVMSHFDSLGLNFNRNNLSRLLNNVAVRNPRLKALPEKAAEKKEFYDAMQHHLEHIALSLSDPTIPEGDKKTALFVLAEAGNWCAARYMQDAIAAQRILGRDPGEDREDKAIYDVLARLRNKIFYDLLGRSLENAHSANIYNALMSDFGVAIGIAKENESYRNDPCGPKINIESSTSAFYKNYSFQAMKRAIRQAIESKEIPPALIPALLSELRPRSAQYVDETEFMNLVLGLDGSVTDEGLFYLLLAMGILIPKDPREHPLVVKYGLLVKERPVLLDLINMPITMTDYWAAVISLQSVTPKNRKSYVQALIGVEFSAKIGRNLSKEQAEKIIHVMENCTEEDEILSNLSESNLMSAS